MKRWILANVAFIASSLVAPGSIITEEDLGTTIVKDPETGKEKEVKVKPPHDAIEIDANGGGHRSDRTARGGLGEGRPRACHDEREDAERERGQLHTVHSNPSQTRP